MWGVFCVFLFFAATHAQSCDSFANQATCKGNCVWEDPWSLCVSTDCSAAKCLQAANVKMADVRTDCTAMKSYVDCKRKTGPKCFPTSVAQKCTANQLASCASLSCPHGCDVPLNEAQCGSVAKCEWKNNNCISGCGRYDSDTKCNSANVCNWLNNQCVEKRGCSALNSTQCRNSAACLYYTTESICKGRPVCKTAGCTNYGCEGQKDAASCTAFSKECEFVGSACQERKGCAKYTDKSSCGGDNVCEWSETRGKCRMMGGCGDWRDITSCKADPGCVWSIHNQKCYLASDHLTPDCSKCLLMSISAIFSKSKCGFMNEQFGCLLEHGCESSASKYIDCKQAESCGLYC